MDDGSTAPFVWGKKDSVVPIDFATGAQSRIPHSKLVVHPEGGHHLQEEESEWLAAQILKF